MTRAVLAMVVKEGYISIEAVRMETETTNQGRTLLCRESKCKGSEAGTHLMCSRNREENSVAGTE